MQTEPKAPDEKPDEDFIDRRIAAEAQAQRARANPLQKPPKPNPLAAPPGIDARK